MFNRSMDNAFFQKKYPFRSLTPSRCLYISVYNKNLPTAELFDEFFRKQNPVYQIAQDMAQCGMGFLNSCSYI